MTANRTPPDPSAEHDQPHHASPDESAEWDALYGNMPIWSGDPNGALVAEVAHLPPGRALDVGCGEGADAVWLAGRGWNVTGLDVSQVALDRAAEHAVEAGVSVTWLHSGLIEARLRAGSFDLVSALYPGLRRTPGQDAERALLAAVAPGGVLLVVHHKIDPDQHEHRSFDPADFVLPSQVAAVLDDRWDVEVDHTRARKAPRSGAGAHHADDIVLRARRLR
jgi:SAM-dependent methyltransferase